MSALPRHDVVGFETSNYLRFEGCALDVQVPSAFVAVSVPPN